MEIDHQRTVVELIAERAENSPNAIAVEDAQGNLLSFGELEAKTERWAALLRQEGIDAERIVSVAASASIETIAGILGILKAGGAYLPLDLSSPRARLQTMLEDAQPALVLCDELGADKLTGCGFRLISLLDTTAADNAASQAEITPDQLAYVIFTSGSTGQPKGVLLEHCGLSNMAQAHANVFGVRPGSRVLQFSSLSFDASVHEIFMALVAGGTLCLARREQMAPGKELVELLQQRRITNVLLPPTALAQLPEADLPDLQTLIAGGERCPAALVKRWGKGRNFFNAYGPTESTVTATIWKCDPEDDLEPPIGSARPGAELWNLSDEGTPVTLGEVGELHVGGIGLARGYLNRPGLTAETFITKSLAGRGSQRLYRTGDLVRERTAGVFDFLGRADRQVKVRGFRIELDEIESCLTSHPAISAGAVRLLERNNSHAQLAGYYVAADQLGADEVRAYLAERLPVSMVPSHLLPLDKLPQAASGKIDYQELPNPLFQTHEQKVQANESAKNAIESRLTEIWEEVLGLEVNREDHFIELGGDSLLSVQVSLLAQAAGLEFTSAEVLAHPTVAQLAHLLESRS